jgi:hypothetical protein
MSGTLHWSHQKRVVFTGGSLISVALERSAHNSDLWGLATTVIICTGSGRMTRFYSVLSGLPGLKNAGLPVTTLYLYTGEGITIIFLYISSLF